MALCFYSGMQPQISEKMAKAIVIVPIDSLKPYEKNPRYHSEESVDELCALIKEVGFLVPILVDAHKGLIAGHRRLRAARKLKMTHVPIIELTHLSETQKRAYIIADNRIQENSSGWDQEKLAEEMRWLEEQSFEMELTGFDENTLAEIMQVQPEAEEDVTTHQTVGKTPTEKLEKFMKREFKQVTLFYEKEDYATFINKVSAYAKKHSLEDNSAALMQIVQTYVKD